MKYYARRVPGQDIEDIKDHKGHWGIAKDHKKYEATIFGEESKRDPGSGIPVIPNKFIDDSGSTSTQKS